MVNVLSAAQERENGLFDNISGKIAGYNADIASRQE
jgi:hypothetical protein